MKKKISKIRLAMLSGAVLTAAFLCGCENLGATQPVLGGSSSANPNGYYIGNESRFTPRESPAPVSYDDSAIVREMATLRADFRLLQEDLQKLSFRMESLERENLAKDAQLKELQSLLSVLDGQIASADKQWSDRMENLKRNMDAEREQRRKQLESLSTNVAQELSRVRTPQASTPTTGPEKFKELVIQKGDTLSTIAAQTGTTVAQLKQFNGLRNDQIRVGQVLKIPVK